MGEDIGDLQKALSQLIESLPRSPHAAAAGLRTKIAEERAELAFMRETVRSDVRSAVGDPIVFHDDAYEGEPLERPHRHDPLHELGDDIDSLNYGISEVERLEAELRHLQQRVALANSLCQRLGVAPIFASISEE